MAGSLGIGITIGAKVGPTLSSAFATVQDKIRATQKSFRQAASQSARLSDALAARQKRDALAAKIQDGGSSPQLLAELKKLSLEYARVAKSAGVYGQSVAEITRRQREMARATEAGRARLAALQSAQGARNAMRDESQKRKDAVTSAIGGAAAAFAMAAPIKIGMEFDSTMSKVGAISRASGEDLAKLRAQARKLGAETVWSAKEAAEGMTYLSMAGFKTNEVYAAMPGMLSLASAAGSDLGRTADIASNILSGFGMEASKMDYVGDVLAKVFTSSNTTLESLGESFKYAAPAAKAAGQSFQDVAVMIGVLGDAGIQGSMAGTAMNAMLMRLASKPKMTMEALNMLNVSVADANGNIRAMPDLLTELGAKMSKMGSEKRVSLARAIFGTENAKSGLILMEQALKGEIQKKSKAAYEKGFSDNMAKEMTNNLAGDLKALNSASEEVSHCFFDVVNPALRQVTQGIIPIVQATGQWITANPRLTQGLMILGGAFVALKAAGLAFTLINSYRKTFTQGMAVMREQTKVHLGEVSGSFGRLRAELARPVSASFAGAGQGLTTLKTRLDSVRQSAAGAIQRLRQVTPASAAAGAAAAASGALAATGRAGWNTLRLGLRGVGMAFKTMFGPMSLIMMGLTYGVEQIIENWDKIQPYFQALWNGVKAIFNSVMGWLQPIIDKIMGYIKPFTEGFGKVLESVGGLWDKIWGNDKEKERKEKEKAQTREKQKSMSLSAEDEAALADPVAKAQAAAMESSEDAAIKTPEQLMQEREWADEGVRRAEQADEDEKKEKAEKAAKKAERIRKQAEKAAKEKAGAEPKKPKYRKNSPMPEFEEESSEEEENAAAAAYEPVLKKQAAKKRASAQAAPAAQASASTQSQAPQTQTVQPQVQVSLNITQNGIPDAQFAQGVMNAIKSRQSELEAMISAIVNDQARLAYG